MVPVLPSLVSIPGRYLQVSYFSGLCPSCQSFMLLSSLVSTRPLCWVCMLVRSTAPLAQSPFFQSLKTSPSYPTASAIILTSARAISPLCATVVRWHLIPSIPQVWLPLTAASCGNQPVSARAQNTRPSTLERASRDTRCSRQYTRRPSRHDGGRGSYHSGLLPGRTCCLGLRFDFRWGYNGICTMMFELDTIIPEYHARVNTFWSAFCGCLPPPGTRQ